MAEVSRLKRSRSANKNVVSGLIVKAKEAKTRDDTDGVVTKLTLVKAKGKLIEGLNEKIQTMIDETEIEADVDACTVFEEATITDVLMLEKFVAVKETKPTVPSGGSSQPDAKDVKSMMGVILPKIQIKKFTGDPTTWVEFSDIFEATVDKNARLSEIEKFTYLKSHLGGAAEKCIEGIPLTKVNYVAAIKLLKERFGNKQLITATHIGKLLKLERVRNGRNVREVRDLFDKIESHVRCLVSVGVQKEEIGPLLIPIVLDRLPDDIKLQVSRNIGKSNTNWQIEEFMNTLKEEITARENCDFMKTQSEKPVNNGKDEEIPSSETCTTHDLLNNTKTLNCAFCRQSHYHDQCRVVTDVRERKEIARKHRLCFKCLFKGHVIKKCQSNRRCFSCKSKSHHTAICERDTDVQSQGVVTSRRSVFLETVCGLVADNAEEKNVPAKILLDKGAQSTYIVDRLVKKLDLQPEESNVNVKINGFGDKHGKTEVLKQYSFCVKNPRVGCNVYLKGLAVEFISPRLAGQRYDVAVSRYPELEGLNLSRVDDDRDIEILIGSDYYNSVVGDEKKRFGENGELAAVNSKLGWVLSGPCTIPGESDLKSNHQLMVGYEEEEKSLNAQVAKFWSLDSMGIADNEKSVYDGFLDEVSFIGECSRYQIRLPFKEDHPMIEDQYHLSMKLLLKLKEKFEKDKKFRDHYDEVMQRQIQLGIIEKVETQPIPGKVSYLSHFAVVREDKETTKLRVVYNGSAKTRGPSLNDCLYKGENLNPLLYDILLRFRVHCVALSADVEAAYLQILVHPEDRDYMRLLYFDDVTAEKPKITKFRFTRVIFGASSSTFLLAGVFRIHAEKYKGTDPEFVEKLLRHLYADDFNGGSPDRESGLELYTKLKSRFAEANFNFRKWRTNDKVLQEIINERQGDEVPTAEGTTKVHKVLGVRWTDDDELMIDVSSYVKDVEEGPTTKRTVLKVMASVYDPIGFITGYVIKLKIFFQELCVLGVGWDEKLEERLTMRWMNIIRQFKEAEAVVVQRSYSPNDVKDPIVKTEIVGFSDSSPKAYGCVLYFRFTKTSGEIKVTLVTSKSRVTPIEKSGKKKCTLPRCELLGNLCLSELVASVRGALEKEMTFYEHYCFGDSEISLAWIRASSKEFKTFVQNRVLKIRNMVKKEKWFYCKSEENPADIVTREDKEPMLELWWNGPKFLHNESEFQQNLKVRNGDIRHPEFVAEIRASVIATLPATTHMEYTIGNVIDITRFNDLLKLLRVTAFVLRFIDNLKAKRNKRSLVLSKYVHTIEMKEAKLAWIKDNQRTITEKRLNDVQVNLNLRRDSEGVIRSYSRLKNAKIPLNMKAPIYLNREHKLADIIVYYSHLKVLHRGVKQTLTEMRSNYWVTRGRSLVKKLLHPCSVCKKLNSRSYYYPEHSDLPKLRFDDRFPFSSTGVDYLGPLYCYPVYGEKKTVQKAYMALFTCASTRAVSLEVVHDAQSTTFTDAFSRFIARRGCPNIVVSDNGPTFDAKETKKFLADHFVEWRPILEAAPWMGGMYERLVASVKRCIKKVVGVRTLTFIDLQTLAAEIELILNNRRRTHAEPPHFR